MAKLTAARLAALALQREGVDTVFYLLSAPIVADLKTGALPPCASTAPIVTVSPAAPLSPSSKPAAPAFTDASRWLETGTNLSASPMSAQPLAATGATAWSWNGKHGVLMPYFGAVRHIDSGLLATVRPLPSGATDAAPTSFHIVASLYS